MTGLEEFYHQYLQSLLNDLVMGWNTVFVTTTKIYEDGGFFPNRSRKLFTFALYQVINIESRQTVRINDIKILTIMLKF